MDDVTDISVMAQMKMFAQFYDELCQLTKTGFLSIKSPEEFTICKGKHYNQWHNLEHW